MNNANEYVVQKIDEDEFELWFEDTLLATMTKEEAYPVMLGQIHPQEYLAEQREAQPMSLPDVNAGKGKG
jgi:hypothetical protein